MASKLTSEEIGDRVRRATINAAADIDPLVADPGDGFKIVVDAIWLSNNVATAQTFQFKSGTAAAGTIPAGMGPIVFQGQGGMVLPYMGIPYFECAASEPLAVDLAAATAVGGGIFYHLEIV